MKKLLTLILLTILLSSCADTVSIKECVLTPPCGFWYGLWHGIIAPLSFFISLLNENISVYAINNNGGWYDFGFLIGTGVLFGSSTTIKK